MPRRAYGTPFRMPDVNVIHHKSEETQITPQEKDKDCKTSSPSEKAVEQ